MPKTDEKNDPMFFIVRTKFNLNQFCINFMSILIIQQRFIHFEHNAIALAIRQ